MTSKQILIKLTNCTIKGLTNQKIFLVFDWGNFIKNLQLNKYKTEYNIFYFNVNLELSK